MKNAIMSNSKLSDMEKLQKIFDIEKEKLKKQFPELYYATLAVLDQGKKPDASGYFNA